MRITEQSPSPGDDGMVPASIPSVPVTELRKPYIAYNSSLLQHPGVNPYTLLKEIFANKDNRRPACEPRTLCGEA